MNDRITVMKELYRLDRVHAGFVLPTLRELRDSDAVQDYAQRQIAALLAKLEAEPATP